MERHYTATPPPPTALALASTVALTAAAATSILPASVTVVVMLALQPPEVLQLPLQAKGAEAKASAAQPTDISGRVSRNYLSWGVLRALASSTLVHRVLPR